MADERDVIRVRTNYRKDPPEDVYVYPLRGPRENIRRLFLEYVRKMNALREHPEFYNTLTTNCTTAILMNTRVNPGSLPFSWKVLRERLYACLRLRVGPDGPEPALRGAQAALLVNAAAQAADQAPDFSRRIRAGSAPPLPAAEGAGAITCASHARLDEGSRPRSRAWPERES